ncbi:MAG: hypothetical protein Q9166_000974 [cf. Caloplaca sp. 2 TL-2023]
MTAFDICSQSGSVESWLAEQPEDPKDYEPSLVSYRKRPSQRRGIDVRKRRCLSEIEPNTVLMDPPKKGQRVSPYKEKKHNTVLKDSPEKRQQAKFNKQKKKDASTLPSSLALRSRTRSVPDEAVFDDIELDNERTPRAIRKTPSLKGYPKFDPPTADAEQRSSEDDGVTSNADTTSTNRTRPSSPRKARQKLLLAEVGIIPVTIGTKGFELPKEAQNLCRDLRRLQTQRGLLPLSVRNDARDELEFDDDMYYSEQPEPAEILHSLNHEEVWKSVHFIRDAAQEAFDEDSPESTWNMTVHAPILQTALRGHWKSQEIWYKDLTTARVCDKDLLPKVQGASVKSKMVDFGIVIQPQARSTLWDEVVQVCKSQAYHTVNQTDAPHLCKTPIAISMEVKRAGGSEDEALVQLETWVTAHYNNLRVLLRSRGEEAELPILPLIQTQGHEWRLIIAEMDSNESLIILHRGIKLGSTDSMLGIYQIIASIDRLAQWVSADYRIWWTRSVLGYDEGGATSQDSTVD